MRTLLAASVLLGTLGANHAVGQDCRWGERLPIHHPDHPGEQRMAFDSTRNVSVLFNSETVPNVRETLEWDGQDWILVATDGPQTRAGTAMAFDSARNVCVLFGGRFGESNHADTWEWDGQAWAQAFPISKPKSRYYHSMVYDSGRDVAVMFGGADEDDNEFGDTWEWDGATWEKASNSGPSPRYVHSMAYDAHRGVTVLYGGAGPGVQFADTWEWDGSAWTQREANGAPGKLFRAAMVYDSNRQVCVLYGGSCQDCGNSPSDETWQWDGQAWTKLNPPENPGRRARHAMAYDSARHAVVLFGGVDAADKLLDDTWELACEPPCYADFTGEGALDIFDFLAFVNAFNAGEGDKADCDSSGSLDLFDFFCFVNAFNLGC